MDRSYKVAEVTEMIVTTEGIKGIEGVNWE
jgi:hypothetical protein